MELSTGRRGLQISVAASLNAFEVEKLIGDLAVLRAQMEPFVPLDTPDPDGNVSAQDNPSIMVKPLRDGRIRLWIRNQGIGWLAFQFAVENAIALRDFFVANTPATTASPSLFGDKDGTSH